MIGINMHLSDSMPMYGYIFCQQTILELDNDSVSLLSKYGWSWSSAIDSDNKFLKAIRGLILILHLPFVMPNLSFH
jgi:hypothetical protein